MLKPLFLLIGLLLLAKQEVLATWSIMVIDPNTREIGIAGASCTPNCYGIGEIIPGEGAIIVQAMSNKAARAKGQRMIIGAASPAEIIEALKDPAFDPERQQYAVLMLRHLNSAKTYTGKETHEIKGALTAEGICVQGNTLATEEVLMAVMKAAAQAKFQGLSIDMILMMALEAGAKAGGDKRCGEQRATSAFLTVARPGDHHRRPYLNLQITHQSKGGSNAVALLQQKHARWRARQ